jgi:hypothetical protein
MKQKAIPTALMVWVAWSIIAGLLRDGSIQKLSNIRSTIMNQQLLLQLSLDSMI